LSKALYTLQAPSRWYCHSCSEETIKTPFRLRRIERPRRDSSSCLYVMCVCARAL